MREQAGKMTTAEEIENVENTIVLPENTEEKLNDENIVEKSRQCPICHVYYKYGNSYWQHVRYVHASVLSQCVICEKCYKRTTMAKHHILHAHKIAWHWCGNYVRKIRKTDLSQKQNSEEGGGKRQNTDIKLKYFKKKTLHLIRSFTCYYCCNSFPTINELFDHVKVHKDEYETDSDETDDSVAESNHLTDQKSNNEVLVQ